MAPHPFETLLVGRDEFGLLREVFSYDSSGTWIGYIDPAGNCWESREEADTACLAGRLIDEFTAWLDGKAPKAPSLRGLLREHVAPEFRAAAAARARADLLWVIESRGAVGMTKFPHFADPDGRWSG